MIEFAALLERCAPHVAPITMQAVIAVESARRPHAIGYKVVAANGAVFTLTSQPRDTGEAQQWATWFLERGYKFDAGIAQVNTVNFNRVGLTVSNMFDPCANVGAGAQILQECYARALRAYRETQTALRAALSCYQSGNFTTGFHTGYVGRVTRAAGAGTTGLIGAAPPLSPLVPLAPVARGTTRALRGATRIPADAVWVYFESPADLESNAATPAPVDVSPRREFGTTTVGGSTVFEGVEHAN